MLLWMMLGGLAIAPSDAQAIEAYPGSTWGNVSYSPNDESGNRVMGWVNQGIDWTTLPGGVVVNTFAEYRYRDRSKQPEYYNSQGPALGLELKWSVLKLGVNHYWETMPDYPGGAQHSSIRQYYLTGFTDWDLTKKADLRVPGAIGLPGSVWFNMNYDINGLTGSGGMGWINQGIDWFTLSGGAVFTTYAEYRYRARTKLDEFYDARGPVLGLEFRMPLVRVGADYYWQYFPVQNERINYLEFYLTWYVDWDLKK